MSIPAPAYPIIVLTAPSGAGKTTIARRLMDAIPELRFSVSATTRPPRPGEVEGEHYCFISEADFRERIAAGAFIEYEEVYPGRFYGTLRSEIEQKAAEAPVLLDIDVRGALNVEKLFGDRALSIFIRPPSFEILAERLAARRTETQETLAQRLARAREELTYEGQFDVVIVNDVLDAAAAQAIQAVKDLMERHRIRHEQA
jgi:guanylate kinase